MTKEEIRARYSRIPTDFSQIEMLKNQLLEAGLIDVAQINPENAGKAIVFDENGALTVGEAAGGGSVTIDGTSLVIPEQPAPEPIINIDGVDYYHKHEFDLIALAEAWSGTDYKVDILTGEVTETSYPTIFVSNWGSSEFRYVNASTYMSSPTIYTNNPAVEVTYISHAFTIVADQSEVTDGTKICLPDCYAYYGFLSEDGKTFISYFTLKTDIDGPSKIDSVKQGDTIIPIVVEASGGTKLYRHYLSDSTNGVNIRLISTDADPYTASGTDLFAKLERAMLCPSTSDSDIMAVRYRGSDTLAAITFSGTSVSFDSDNYTDIVTEL